MRGQLAGRINTAVRSSGCRSGARPAATVAVATPARPPTAGKPKRSKVELIKEQSDFLRHPLMEELVTPEPNIGEEAMQLMKFHGSYQQVIRGVGAAAR